VFKWDGHKFKEAAQQEDSLDDPLEYHWDGEKFIEEDVSKRAPKSSTPEER
jgi:hypothetical protein